MGVQTKHTDIGSTSWPGDRLRGDSSFAARLCPSSGNPANTAGSNGWEVGPTPEAIGAQASGHYRDRLGGDSSFAAHLCPLSGNPANTEGNNGWEVQAADAMGLRARVDGAHAWSEAVGADASVKARPLSDEALQVQWCNKQMQLGQKSMCENKIKHSL